MFSMEGSSSIICKGQTSFNMLNWPEPTVRQCEGSGWISLNFDLKEHNMREHRCRMHWEDHFEGGVGLGGHLPYILNLPYPELGPDFGSDSDNRAVGPDFYFADYLWV